MFDEDQIKLIIKIVIGVIAFGLILLLLPKDIFKTSNKGSFGSGLKKRDTSTHAPSSLKWGSDFNYTKTSNINKREKEKERKSRKGNGFKKFEIK